MKKILISALALAVATPALASDASLAASLGVPAGEYTTAQLVQLKAKEGAPAGESHVRLEASEGVVNDTAARIFRDLAAEDSTGANGGTFTVETSRGAINDIAAQKFEELAAE